MLEDATLSERTRMQKFVTWAIGGIFAALVIVVSSALYADSIQRQRGPITWMPNPIVETVVPGQSVDAVVSLISSKELDNVVVVVTGDIAPFVEIGTPTLGRVPANQEIAFLIKIAVPDTAITSRGKKRMKSIEGDLVLRLAKVTRHGSTKLTKPVARLPVSLEVSHSSEWPIVTNAVAGYSVSIPPTWKIVGDPDTTSSIELTPPGKTPDSDSEYVADLVIESLANPFELEFTEFYQQSDQTNYFSESRSQTFLNINGAPAVRFDGVFGVSEMTIISIGLPGQIVEVRDLDNNHQSDGVFDAVANSVVPSL